MSNYDQSHQSKIYQCSICYKNYSSRISLRDHINGIHEKKFKCGNCGKCFSSNRRRNGHVAKKVCGKNFESIDIVPFFMRDEYFECNYCYFNSESETEFNQHFESDHEDLNEKIKVQRCPICFSVLSSEHSLRIHLKTLHGYDPRDQDLGKTEQRFLECYHCDKKFHLANKPKLEIHLLQKHFPLLATAMLRAGKFVGQSSFTSLRIIEDNGKFKCKTCNKSFKTRSDALSHSRYICHRNWTAEDYERETERILECFLCGEKFKQCEKLKLISHMKHQHIQSNLKCHICSKFFDYAYLLKEHIEGIHEKKIKCEKCKQCFTNKRTLMYHIRKNFCKLWSKTELKSFAPPKKLSKEDLTCKICSKVFKKKSLLKRHAEAVHEKKIKAKCEMCGKTFSRNGKIREHLRFNRCKREK